MLSTMMPHILFLFIPMLLLGHAHELIKNKLVKSPKNEKESYNTFSDKEI